MMVATGEVDAQEGLAVVQQTNANGQDATSQLRSRRWRLRHSLWMLPAIVGIGLFTWVSFLYIGVRAKRPGWLAAAGAYFVGMVAVFAIDAVSATGSVLESVWILLTLTMWIGGIVHAAVSNRNWLRWHASATATPWYLAEDPDPDRPVDLYVPGYDDVAFDPALAAVRELPPPTSPTPDPAPQTPRSVAPPPPSPPPPPS